MICSDDIDEIILEHLQRKSVYALLRIASTSTHVHRIVRKLTETKVAMLLSKIAHTDRFTTMEVLRYWSKLIVWIYDKRFHGVCGAYAQRFVPHREYFHRIPPAFTVQIVARVDGDVTMLHVPGVCEICHGYPREATDRPPFCVVHRGRFHYGHTRANNRWHVYTVHVSPRETLFFIDDHDSLYRSHKASSTPIAHHFWVGCDQYRQYRYHNAMELRLIAESSLSFLTMEMHHKLTRVAKEWNAS